jgi:hypothetical protein
LKAEEEELLHEQIEITHDDASGTTTIKSQRKANPPQTEPEPEPEPSAKAQREQEPSAKAQREPAPSAKAKRKKQRQLLFPSQKGFLWPVPASRPEPALALGEGES